MRYFLIGDCFQQVQSRTLWRTLFARDWIRPTESTSCIPRWFLGNLLQSILAVDWWLVGIVSLVTNVWNVWKVTNFQRNKAIPAQIYPMTDGCVRRQWFIEMSITYDDSWDHYDVSLSGTKFFLGRCVQFDFLYDEEMTENVIRVTKDNVAGCSVKD